MKKNISQLTSHRDLHKKWMKDPKYVHEYRKLDPEYQIASQLIEARIKYKMTQEELAIKIGTGQAVISRLEGMNARPSLALLKRIAGALDTKFHITIQ